jgi:Ca2+-binding RTX toxin-like protein
MKRFSLVSVVVALFLTASTSTATAQVTVGQVGVPDTNCRAGDWAEPTVSSGTPYVVPVTGTLSSWSHIARVAAGQKLKVKVFRQVPGLTTTYTVVGQDVSRDLTSGTINTFTTNIPVQVGDVLGMTTLSPQGASGVGCGFGAATETILNKEGSDAPTGSGVAFDAVSPIDRLNISAVIDPAPGEAIVRCKGQQATIIGTSGADEIDGTTGRDVIVALGGKDKAFGLAGKDLICGGGGRDKLNGGGGKDTLLGQKGADTLKGGGGNDTCKGGKGRDVEKSC